VKLRELADIVKISKERVGFILHEHLTMRKLCSKWVPRLLTVDQKQKRVDDSEQCLAMFKRFKLEILRRYVTMDETWNQNDRHLSGQLLVNLVQSALKQYFGMCVV